MKSLFQLLLLVSLCSSLHGQNRPLRTEFAEPVARGSTRIEFGFEFLQDSVFRLSGLEGDLTRLGLLGVRIGASDNVELQFFWTAQDFLNINSRMSAPGSENLDFSGNSTSDFGNLRIGGKFRIRPEKESSPALGFRFGAELPNASTEKGIGTDELNFFADLLLEKRINRVQVLGNAGLAILGDPVTPGAQDDLFTYGLAVLYGLSDRLKLLVDLNGRAGPGGVGTEEQSTIRLGTQVRAAGLYWDAALMVGLLDADPSTGVVFGVSKDFNFSLFK